MPVTITSQELNRKTGSAKRSALESVVIITTRRKPTHVLMSLDEYHRLTRYHRIGNLLSTPEDVLNFEPSPIAIGSKLPDFH